MEKIKWYHFCLFVPNAVLTACVNFTPVALITVRKRVTIQPCYLQLTHPFCHCFISFLIAKNKQHFKLQTDYGNRVEFFILIDRKKKINV